MPSAEVRAHLAGLSDIGWSSRLGWYEGFHVLLAVNPLGAITGFGTASATDQPLAETFCAARHCPHPALRSRGAPAAGPYLTVKGFEGQAYHQHWREDYGAVVICAPKSNSRHPWSDVWRCWLAGLRQIWRPSMAACTSASVSAARARTPSKASRRAWLKAALHNFCIWLNEQLGRTPLASAGLIAW